MTIKEVFGNFSIFFLSINPVLSQVRLVTPSTIYFGGGLHLQPPKPLPKVSLVSCIYMHHAVCYVVENFFDGAKEGAI